VRFAGGSGALTFAGPNWDRLDPGLVRYLQANQGSAEYLVATTSSSYASLFILDSREPAMALGGYQGWDRVLTPVELSQIVTDGVVRFFYLPSQPAAAGLDATRDLVTWVEAHCSVVRDATWQPNGGLQLYDCQA